MQNRAPGGQSRALRGTWARAAVATGPPGQILVAGCFQGSVRLGGPTLASAGGFDAFVVALAPPPRLARSRGFEILNDEFVLGRWMPAVTGRIGVAEIPVNRQ